MAYITAKEARDRLSNENMLPSEVMALMQKVLKWGFANKAVMNRMEKGAGGHPPGKMIFTTAEFNKLKKEL